jgi:hypothetical protein
MRNLLLAVLFAFSLPAFANKDAPEDASNNDEHHHSRFQVGIGPAWVHVLRDDYSPAFTNNGFKAPGRDRVAFDFLAFWTTESQWQLGLGMTSFSLEQDVGTWSADYSNNVLGIYVAKNFSADHTYDITLGGLLGFDNSTVSVFSANQNGRLRENAAVIAPSIGYAAVMSRMVKLGVRGTYFIPFGESTQLSGADLGISKIGTRGFLLALDVIFGRYW